jgi:hypothetical protein
LRSSTTPKEQLEKNLKSFNRQLANLKKYGFSEVAAIMAQRASTFATYRHTGLFASVELDDFISDISEKKVCPKAIETPVKRGSTLHILSRALEGGGHTRVVERWISSSPLEEVHSALITRGGAPTQDLKNGVSAHQGEIFVQRRFSRLISRARKIQKISSNYSRVVLHVHMDDILPLLAFSREDNSPEIFHFNHADHRFWVGSTLPDRVIEMRSWGKTLSEMKRGLFDSEVVGIPLPDRLDRSKLERSSARKTLGIHEDTEVLLTVGHPRKYLAETQLHFAEAVRVLLLGFPKRQLFAVGPGGMLDAQWKKLASDFPNQVRLLPYIAKEKLGLLIGAADIGLDSFPMSGGTAVLEMLANELPFVSLKCATGHFDAIYASPFYCETLDDWVEKANQLLNQQGFGAQESINKVLIDAEKKYGSVVWAGVLNRKRSTQLPFPKSEEVNIEDLNEYLIVSTPKLARLFF